ncbi:MAG: DUF455 family protein [Planctomycetaceae bacterium]|nr:DUF455 family protein [Planctomycetaceae bacterium]
MELRDFAEAILTSPDLETKLTVGSDEFTDRSPGSSRRLHEPARCDALKFAPPRSAPAMPKMGAFPDEKKRGLAHHILANHELQALEAMAWTLLAFPDAPTEFRLGVAEIMREEQRHTRMHAERASRLGICFGDYPVNCYIWKKMLSFESVLDYVAGLPLVFEGANLDHSLEFADAFRSAGDLRSAALMQTIHRDEIKHVRFGWNWLCQMAPAEADLWEIWTKHLHWPLRAIKARGNNFQRDARLEAGMPVDFVDRLEHLTEEEAKEKPFAPQE